MSSKGREVNTASHSSARLLSYTLTFPVTVGPDTPGRGWHYSIPRSDSSPPLRPDVKPLSPPGSPESQIGIDGASVRFTGVYPSFGSSVL